ncbi:acriflavin resistance protein [Candidatus Thiodiazotropha endoloripes]|uniref:efflux RND transporter permease subunit n=1 Tax=Candidatus Thiodiazotropha endoloripes TaxID=1818881 RepID=UPI00083E11B2|nr:efflux RND transporter permease subunit [Candidatus Thiodiazotropha endoloripes]ODB92279.1 acriflavin resistance protein [Candidatus Thiodiazotropha endoloripes]
MKKAIGGGLAAWSIHHPIGVVMLTLAVMVLGLLALGGLGVDLLPKVIYPEIKVRVVDPGVPANIMEDQVTRQLEEQLAITEEAVFIQSRTTEGRSAVDLSFRYGTDIDQALQDASTRLDRAKRFLPESIEPPIIFKRDPSQLPVAEFVVSSSLRDPVSLRSWVDFEFSKWFVNLPGVASAEVGGGLEREITVQADQLRLAGLGMHLLDLRDALKAANVETASGRLVMQQGELSGRTAGRFNSVEEILQLPLRQVGKDETSALIRLYEVADVADSAEDERLRIRLNDLPGIKLSVQKQPTANTVEVVDHVLNRLDELRAKGLLPKDIEVHAVDDQARFVRKALDNAINSALTGALLAMLVVYLFLGSLRRTLIIGSAIPISILVTFILMTSLDLALNIMTLGGLALGIGMLVDSTIVMLENIYRHQHKVKDNCPSALVSQQAAAEVNSAIVASTSTNLAAVLPFLFIGGLVGLLFRELIYTISAAILASMVVALTLVPALAGKLTVNGDGVFRQYIDRLISGLQSLYSSLITQLLRIPWLMPLLFILALLIVFFTMIPQKQVFLPQIDEGRISISITADRGINLQGMDELVSRIEGIISSQPETDSLFTQVGGFVFGRTQYEAVNRASIKVTLKPYEERGISSRAWIKRVNQQIREARLPGVRVYLRVQGIRGIRLNRGDDDLSIRVKGPDLKVLNEIAQQVKQRLGEVSGLNNIEYTGEELTQEISLQVDRQRASSLGLSVEDVGQMLKLALGGEVVTDYLEGDRSIDVRLRLQREDLATPADVESIIIFSRTDPPVPLRLGEVADVELAATPVTIQRDQQQRMIEISASLGGELSLGVAIQEVNGIIDQISLPAGYSLYEAGGFQAVQQGREMGMILLALALFLVLVVMAVQYESIRNPMVIMLSVPFALIGVAFGLNLVDLPLSMPVWLGLIMLSGIVVNNAIVLVEYIGLRRDAGAAKNEAIIEASRLRLRPILMTTLTTVAGMMPLALALGEGSEMLQPLAVTLVSGLIFSTLVTLLLIPMVYRLIGR